MDTDSPIRPNPTNPQVAHLDPLVAKVLLDIIDAVLAPPLPSRRSFEGDKRTEMAALMVNDEQNKGHRESICTYVCIMGSCGSCHSPHGGGRLSES